MKSIIPILAAIALACGVATAADETKPGSEKPKHNPEDVFKKIDSNGDGKISLDEWKAGPRGKKDPEKAEEMFKKLDTNGDGFISLDEFKAHGHGAGKGAKKPSNQ